MDLLTKAVYALTGRCDGAAVHDGMGCNKLDAPFMHDIASIDPNYWTVGVKQAAWFKLKKYAKQLSGMGIDVSSIPKPETGYVKPAKKPETPRIIELHDDFIAVSFPFDQNMVNRLKAACPGGAWKAQPRHWRFPLDPDAGEKLIAFGQAENFHIPPELPGLVKRLNEMHSGRLTASAAEDADIDIPDCIKKKPFPYQRAGVKYILDVKDLILGDEMGLGKTLQAIIAVEMANAYPCLVVCPASLKYNWEKEFAEAVPHRKVHVVDKRNDLQDGKHRCNTQLKLDGFVRPDCIQCSYEQADVIVINYDIMANGWSAQSKKAIELSDCAIKAVIRQPQSMLLDESHYIKSDKAQRTVACQVIGEEPSIRFHICISGTPIMNKAIELASQLKFIKKLDTVFGGWWKFARDFCGAIKGQFGWEFKGVTNSEKLHKELRKHCYLRRQKKDVLKELPDILRGTIDVEIDNRDDYNRAERELIAWVHERALEDKKQRRLLEEMYGDTELLADKMREYANAKARNAERAEQIVRLSVLKQVAALGILSSAKEWIDNFLESGEKLVVFATHKVILEKLLEMYPNAARILSEQSAQERQANVRKFQEDASCRLIIGAQGTSANNSPAGVGHTLTAASNCLTLELGWNNALHDQCEARCHRIGQKDTVNAWYMRGRNTIYTKLYDLIQEKREIFHAVVDGEEAGSMSVRQELVDYYMHKGE